jgi:hypothetical protein
MKNEEYKTNNIYNVMTARDSLCKYISGVGKLVYIEYILWTPRSGYGIYYIYCKRTAVLDTQSDA